MQEHQKVVEMSLPSSHQAMRQLVLGELSEPRVLRGALLHLPEWEEPLRWTPEYLACAAPGLTTSFKIGKRSWLLDREERTHFETECCYADATLPEFVSWLREASIDSPLKTLHDTNESNSPTAKRAKVSQEQSTQESIDSAPEGASTISPPLSGYAPSEHWAYCDYKYMFQLFRDHPSLLAPLDWSALGFKERGGAHTTIWMGSELAHTPCHYDTYGCNLVAQLHGQKRWYLLAPSESDKMYASRIPYEESSVFSPVNIPHPDYTEHPKFKLAAVFEVVLYPGDVLFVPKHWWHFVVCLDTAVSVNTWIELDSDSEDRLREALVRIMVFSLKCCDKDVTKWLNPKEDYSLLQDNISLLEKALSDIIPLTKTRSGKEIKLEEKLIQIITQRSTLDILSQDLLKLLQNEKS